MPMPTTEQPGFRPPRYTGRQRDPNYRGPGFRSVPRTPGAGPTDAPPAPGVQPGMPKRPGTTFTNLAGQKPGGFKGGSYKMMGKVGPVAGAPTPMPKFGKF